MADTNIDTTPGSGLEAGVSIKKAVLILFITAAIVVAAGVAIGNAFFWNQFSTQTPEDYALQAALITVDEYPEDAMAHLQLGYLYLLRGENEKALNSYQDAYMVSPEDRQVQYNLGLGYLANEMYEEAVDILAPLASREELNFEVNFTYGIAAYHAGRYEDAVKALNLVLNVRPGAADAYSYLGKVYESQGDSELALFNYQKALRFLPDNSELLEAVERLSGNVRGDTNGS